MQHVLQCILESKKCVLHVQDLRFSHRCWCRYKLSGMWCASSWTSTCLETQCAIPDTLNLKVQYWLNYHGILFVTYIYVFIWTSYFSLCMKQGFQLYYYMYYILWLSPQDIWNVNQFCFILQTRSYAYYIISHDMLIESNH